MNWLNIIKLLLPTSMRMGLRMRCVLKGASYKAVSDAEGAEVWKDGVLSDMRYVGQRSALLELLTAKFGSGITFEDYEPSNVAYFSADPGAEEADDGRYPAVSGAGRVYMTPMSFVDLGYDFAINIPSGVDKAAVTDVVRRYIFEGVNFKVIQL